MSLLIDKIQSLQKAKETVASLERSILEERPTALASLPAQYGFDSARAFAKAVIAASQAPRKRSPKLKGARPKRSGKRARITDAMRAEVKEMAIAGKSGSEIAAKVGISLPSVQNIKKALGLTKVRPSVA